MHIRFAGYSVGNSDDIMSAFTKPFDNGIVDAFVGEEIHQAWSPRKINSSLESEAAAYDCAARMCSGFKCG